MKLCCGTNLYASFPLETALQEIRRIGFQHIDLWACGAICDHADPAKISARELRALLAEYDVTAVSMTLFLMDEAERHKRMRFAAELGVPLVIWEPAQSADWPDNMTNLHPSSVAYGLPGGSTHGYHALLRHDAALAEELGLKIGIEVPHCYTLNEYLFQIYRTAKDCAAGNVGFVIAPPHADARGYSAADTLGMMRAEQAYMLYLWDIQKGFAFPQSDRAFGNGSEQMPGGGKRDFAALVKQFEDSGFDGWYNISCHGTEGWDELAKISACLERAYKLATTLLQPETTKEPL